MALFFGYALHFKISLHILILKERDIFKFSKFFLLFFTESLASTFEYGRNEIFKNLLPYFIYIILITEEVYK